MLAVFKVECKAWENSKTHVLIKCSNRLNNANVIESHNMFKREGCGWFKTRIVPRCHRDSAKHESRIDASYQNPETFYIVLFIAAKQRWNIAQMDIPATSLQTCGFYRKVFGKPPKKTR